ncbi:hypothetical protein [Mesorhizobium sp.]|uniref:hypothetical protein n=1 Tax=Mesorhizobium sp. TaxID=1871066 RepID=UPI00342202A2
MALAGLDSLPSIKARPPRVAGAPAHLECLYYCTVDLQSDDPESPNAMVIGRVVSISID